MDVPNTHTNPNPTCQEQQTITRITIHNPVSCHYECIESVIHYLPFILRTKHDEIQRQTQNPILVLSIVPEPGFIKYITTYKDKLIQKYALRDIIITPTLDVGYTENPDINKIVKQAEPGEIRIQLTIPSGEVSKPEIFNWPNIYYIFHNYRPNIATPDNIFFLSPHCSVNRPNNYFIPDVLPFSAKSVSYTDRPRQIPISEGAWILVQGRLTRRVPALIKILNKFICATITGQVGNTQIQPANLVILTKSNSLDIETALNIHMITNSDFWEFHQWAAKCNIIATLVSKQTHNKYYTSKLTSSISYGLAYQMRFLIDRELNDIYFPDTKEISEKQTNKITHGIYTTRQEFIKSLKAICAADSVGGN
jgi:hypothetical protein